MISGMFCSFFTFIGLSENFYAKSKNLYGILFIFFKVYFKILVMVFKIITWVWLWTVGFSFSALLILYAFHTEILYKDLYYVSLWYETGCLKINETVTISWYFCHKTFLNMLFLKLHAFSKSYVKKLRVLGDICGPTTPFQILVYVLCSVYCYLSALWNSVTM